MRDAPDSFLLKCPMKFRLMWDTVEALIRTGRIRETICKNILSFAKPVNLLRFLQARKPLGA